MDHHDQRDFEAAALRAQQMQANLPQAVSAWYDSRSKRIVITLNTGLGVMFSPKLAQGLEDARVTDLEVIEVSPSGFGIHFPRLDADIYLPALFAGSLGSERWMAEHASIATGKPKTAKKSNALKPSPKKKTSSTRT